MGPLLQPRFPRPQGGAPLLVLWVEGLLSPGNGDSPPTSSPAARSEAERRDGSPWEVWFVLQEPCVSQNWVLTPIQHKVSHWLRGPHPRPQCPHVSL